MDTILHLVSKTLWFVGRPGTFALILACIGLAAVWRGRRWGRWPLLAGLGFYVSVLATPLAPWIVMPLEDRFARPAEPPSRVDGVIALGGAVDQNLTEARGLPALNGAAERMTEFVGLARRYPEARLVFTGGQGSLVHGGVTEADVARQVFTAMGLPETRVTYESAARNTWENAVFTHRLAVPQPGETWLLVTSASHMPRSVGAFRRAGWQVVPWPVNYRTGPGFAALYDAPFPERLHMVESGLREWLGLAVYRLLGRSDALFPSP
ncbi:YdcF family protein [Elioraea sp.]|uniref:YdcF family protein n=1 Tax=Elioraea sp. TaxID=2185103 RepID=UPI003F6F13BA